MDTDIGEKGKKSEFAGTLTLEPGRQGGNGDSRERAEETEPGRAGTKKGLITNGADNRMRTDRL